MRPTPSEPGPRPATECEGRADLAPQQQHDGDHVPAPTKPLPRPVLDGAGRHRRRPSATQSTRAGDRSFARRHAVRFTSFGLVGATVFLGGLGLQVLLVQRWHVSAISSYISLGVLSVQASFLLNRRWTWRDRDTTFLSAWWKFNAGKVVTAILNFLVYSGLIELRLNYIVANLLTTAVFTIVNYTLGDMWAFAERKPRHASRGDVLPATTRRLAPASARPAQRDDPDVRGSARGGTGTRGTCPTVSVIVPCKSNEATIRLTVDSLLGQDYPGLVEVILVGSLGDSTWTALEDVTDPRLILIEQAPTPGRRDPNIKRDRGIRAASGDLLALADSDIVMPADWLSRGIAHLAEHEVGCVAGGMRSIHHSFWGRYVDSNRLGAKTPRISAPYTVTAETFGARGKKPPITANVIFTRTLYRRCPLNIYWAYGYEDYEWFWRIARAGFQILVSSDLVGLHHHRRGLAALGREYLRASEGCAKFIKTYPECPLARKRRRQAAIIPVFGSGLLALGGGLLYWHEGAVVMSAFCILPLAAGMWEFTRRRALEAFAYPFITLVVASIFTGGLLKGLARDSGAIPVPLPEFDTGPSTKVAS